MASTDARPIPKKNVAYRHYFAIRKNDGTLITTWAGQDSEVSLDGANFVDCTNEATEIQTSGAGYIDLTSTEMDVDCLTLKVTVTNTDALTYIVNILPEDAGDIRVDVTQISGDSVAADNLEATYDGTGYADDNAPSTQAQLANIANVGSAVKTPATSFNQTSGGTPVNSYTDTAALNGTRHQIPSAANVLDIDYTFGVGSGIPSGVTITGALIGNNDDLKVYAYDYIADGYVQIGEIAGKVSSVNEVNTFDLFTSMVGTGANLGEVKIRFWDDDYVLTSAILYIDQIYISFSSASSGYELGAIWVDTSVTNTGSVVGVDGVATNPVSTWAAALALSAKTNLAKFQIANGSSITLTGDSSGYTLLGESWNLALGGQDISSMFVFGAIVSGIASGTSTAKFTECRIGAVTLPPAGLNLCAIGVDDGSFQAASAGQFIFTDCFSIVAGAGTPDFNFTGTGGITGINVRRWAGGVNYTLDSDCTLSHEVLAGGGTTITTGGADVEVRGITRSLTLVLSNAGTCQFVGTTGPIILSGTTTAIVNLYGVSSSVENTTFGLPTITDNTVSNDRVVDSVWDEQKSEHSTSGSFGLEVATGVSNSSDDYIDLKAGTTSCTIYTKLYDAVTGEPATGLAYNSEGVDFNYIRDRSSLADFTAVSVGLIDAYTSGGFVEVDVTGAPGLYRLDIPNFVLSTGAEAAVIYLLLDGVIPKAIRIGLSTPTAETITDAVWDEELTGTIHNVPSSAGRRLRTVSDLSTRQETAQGPGTGNNQIQLDASASATDGAYDPSLIAIVNGTGSGQSRLILQYDGATKTATVDRSWKTNPDATSEFVIFAHTGREHVNEGLAQAATPTTITLNALASADDDAYRNQMAFIRSGTGEDQVRRVISYVGSTKIATVSRAWSVTPDSTSGYSMLPATCVEMQAIVDTELSVKDGENFHTFFDNNDTTSTTKVSNIDDVSTAGITAAILAMTDVTEGGTWSFQKVITIMAAMAAGNWKDGTGSVKELLDAEDQTTVILEATISETTPYVSIEVKI